MHHIAPALQRTFFLIALGVFGLGTVVMPVQAEGDVEKTLKFPKGQYSTIVSDGVPIRGRNLYTVTARAGQTMTVKIISLENNAVFEVYNTRGPGAYNDVDSPEGMVWSGKLPDSGDYRIVVSTTRGGASYHMYVAIE